MSEPIDCPRCGQDYLRRVELLPIHRFAIMCQECDTLWFSEADVGPATPEEYRSKWFDYETYMREVGHPIETRVEYVNVLGPLLR